MAKAGRPKGHPKTGGWPPADKSLKRVEFKLRDEEIQPMRDLYEELKKKRK